MEQLSIQAAANRFKDAPFVISGGKTISFFAMRQMTTAWTDTILLPISNDLGKTPLAVVATNGVGTVVAILASFAQNTPVLLVHPALPKMQQANLFEQCGARFALENNAITKLNQPLAKSTVRLPAGTQLIMATSGSSGSPRLVYHSKQSLLAAALAALKHLNPSSPWQWIDPLPIAHIGGLSILFRALLGGGAVHLLPRFSTKGVGDAIDAGATWVSLVPTMLQRLLNHTPPVALERLEGILLGGAAIAQPLLEACKERNLRLYPTYGMTEMGSQVATGFPEDPALRPLPGVKIRIGSNDGRKDATGPILLDGPMKMLQAAPAFPDDPKWFQTGDLGRLAPSGTLEIIGRADDIIISGGENVAPTTIGAVIADLPGIKAWHVCGLAHPALGQTVALAVITGNDFSMNQLLSRCKTALAGFQRPRRLLTTRAFPLLANGKIDRIAIKAALEENGVWMNYDKIKD